MVAAEVITLPDTGRWSKREMVRMLRRIETKLDNAPTVAALESVRTEAAAAREAAKADQLRKDQEQDRAIEGVEANHNKLLMLVLGSGLAGVGSLVVSVATAAPR